MKEQLEFLDWRIDSETKDNAIQELANNNNRLMLFYTLKGIIISSNIYDEYKRSGVVEVIKKMGYPCNESFLPILVEVIRKMDKPGAQNAYDYLMLVEKKTLKNLVEEYCHQADRVNDSNWIFILIKLLTDNNIDSLYSSEIYEKYKGIKS